MPTSMSALAILNREFLEIRAKLLELAASLDRLHRGAGSVTNDPRMHKIREALEVLLDAKPDRAEHIQLIFSRQYDDDWQKNFDLTPAS